jgi:glyoxylate reductase
MDAAGGQLRVISNMAVGFDNIDVPAATARGILVTNTPGVLTDATADIAMALILMSTRRLGESERIVRSRQPWRWGMFFLLGSAIQGRRLGIVRMGLIGTALARRARSFGMTIAYSSRRACDPVIAAELDAVRLSLVELIETSDIVSLHVPYSPATHHLIGTEQLRAMKPTAHLINTARGPVVDEAALVAALQAGALAGAALDVFEHEPAVTAELLGMENVVLSPHIASATRETRLAMGMLVVSALRAVLLEDRIPENAV